MQISDLEWTPTREQIGLRGADHNGDEFILVDTYSVLLGHRDDIFACLLNTGVLTHVSNLVRPLWLDENRAEEERELQRADTDLEALDRTEERHQFQGEHTCPCVGGNAVIVGPYGCGEVLCKAEPLVEAQPSLDELAKHH